MKSLIPEKVYDKLLLALSLIIISPLIIAAFISVAVGYPVHLIKKSISSRMRELNAGKSA